MKKEMRREKEFLLVLGKVFGFNSLLLIILLKEVLYILSC